MQNKIKTKSKKMAKTKLTRTFERTIEKELFESWTLLRQTTDAGELEIITGKSYPIIYRALNFGHCKEESIVDDISKFYLNRSLKQKEQAKSILKNLI